MRLAGSLFGGIGLISWLARNAERETRRAIVLGLIVSNSLAAAAALSGAISGVYNQFAWGPVMTFGFFAIAFVQSIFKKSGRAPIHGARGVEPSHQVHTKANTSSSLKTADACFARS